MVHYRIQIHWARKLAAAVNHRNATMLDLGNEEASDNADLTLPPTEGAKKLQSQNWDAVIDTGEVPLPGRKMGEDFYERHGEIHLRLKLSLFMASIQGASILASLNPSLVFSIENLRYS